MRDGCGWAWLSALRRDVRDGIRSLAGRPAFTAVAVLSLALGIGANSAILSLVNAVILRDSPIERPEGSSTSICTRRRSSSARCPTPISRMSATGSTEVFSDIAASHFVPLTIDRGEGGGVGLAPAEAVTGSYFAMLGIEAAVGWGAADGATREEALAGARDLLRELVAATMPEGKGLPEPSRATKRRPPVVPPVPIELKAALYEAFREAGVSQCRLARDLDLAESEVRSMLNPDHATKSAAIDRAPGQHLAPLPAARPWSGACPHVRRVSASYRWRDERSRSVEPETAAGWLAGSSAFPVIRIVLFIVGIGAALWLARLVNGGLGRGLGAWWQGTAANVALQILAVHVAYRGMVRLLEARSAAELCLRGAARETGAGVLVGAGCLTATVGLVVVLGYYHVEGVGVWIALAPHGDGTRATIVAPS